jgi:hypothetical protein
MCLICRTFTFQKYFWFETSFIIALTMRVRPAVLCILLSILNLEMNQSIFIEIFFTSCGRNYLFQKLQENSHKFSFNKHVKILYSIQRYRIKLTVNKYRRLFIRLFCFFLLFIWPFRLLQSFVFFWFHFLSLYILFYVPYAFV